MDILRLFYHQNTAKLIQPSFSYDVLPNYLKIPSFYFNYHFCIDDLLYKIIVLKKAKINAVCNPPKSK